MMKIDYTAFDELIIQSILSGCNTYNGLCAKLEDAAKEFTKNSSKLPHRVIDRRLQAIKQQGLITFSRNTGWNVSEPARQPNLKTESTDLQTKLLEIFHTKGLDWCLKEMRKGIPPEMCLCGKLMYEKGHVLCAVKIDNYRGNEMPIFAHEAATGIRLDKGAALSLRAINFAHAVGWISDWENTFCISIFERESYSGFPITERQLVVRIGINENFLAAYDAENKKSNAQ